MGNGCSGRPSSSLDDPTATATMTIRGKHSLLTGNAGGLAHLSPAGRKLVREMRHNFEKLSIMVDANADGVIDQGEFMTMQQNSGLTSDEAKEKWYVFLLDCNASTDREVIALVEWVDAHMQKFEALPEPELILRHAALKKFMDSLPADGKLDHVQLTLAMEREEGLLLKSPPTSSPGISNPNRHANGHHLSIPSIPASAPPTSAPTANTSVLTASGRSLAVGGGVSGTVYLSSNRFAGNDTTSGSGSHSNLAATVPLAPPGIPGAGGVYLSSQRQWSNNTLSSIGKSTVSPSTGPYLSSNPVGSVSSNKIVPLPLPAGASSPAALASSSSGGNLWLSASAKLATNDGNDTTNSNNSNGFGMTDASQSSHSDRPAGSGTVIGSSWLATWRGASMNNKYTDTGEAGNMLTQIRGIFEQMYKLYDLTGDGYMDEVEFVEIEIKASRVTEQQARAKWKAIYEQCVHNRAEDRSHIARQEYLDGNMSLFQSLPKEDQPIMRDLILQSLKDLQNAVPMLLALRRQLLQQIRGAFEQMFILSDTDGSGTLTADEWVEMEFRDGRWQEFVEDETEKARKKKKAEKNGIVEDSITMDAWVDSSMTRFEDMPIRDLPFLRNSLLAGLADMSQNLSPQLAADTLKELQQLEAAPTAGPNQISEEEAMFKREVLDELRYILNCLFVLLDTKADNVLEQAEFVSLDAQVSGISADLAQAKFLEIKEMCRPKANPLGITLSEWMSGRMHHFDQFATRELPIHKMILNKYMRDLQNISSVKLPAALRSYTPSAVTGPAGPILPPLRGHHRSLSGNSAAGLPQARGGPAAVPTSVSPAKVADTGSPPSAQWRINISPAEATPASLPATKTNRPSLVMVTPPPTT